MLISIDWIKEFVQLPNISPKELGERFTLGVAEVEGVVFSDEYLTRVRIAEIESIEKHPEADKLNLVTFKLSATEKFRVVCGASNVRVGLKVPYAPVFTKLPNGVYLEPKKIRGILSEGMLCSEEELGLPSTIDGLLELPATSTLGQTFGEYSGKHSALLFDVDNKSLTHRPDLWGHFGMAREFATLFKSALKNPFEGSWLTGQKKQIENKNSSPIKVVVDADSSSLGYFGLSVDGVKVTTSPTWLSRRLEEVGMRSINNIVDISNYVMLELGIPNHIFDREKITGNTLTIKRAGLDQNFTTLDGVVRSLSAFDTVIADSDKTLVLAGLMGGENSGVSETTTKIFIEVANWKAAEVRRTSVRLGLRTDSSQRYEKTLDSQMLERTLYRIVELLQKVCLEAKVVGAPEYAGPSLPLKAPLLITTSVEKIQKVLGTSIDAAEIRRIFSSLDFTLSGSDEKLVVAIPSYRATKDIECEADLVEEVGRHVGFDNITPVAPFVPVAPANLTYKQKLHRKIRDYLFQNAHASETLTYPMLGEKLISKMQWIPSSTLKILNSLSEDHDRMRDSLIPSLLEVCALNTKNLDDFRFFELGRTYQQDSKNFARESSVLGMVFNDSDATPFLKLVDQFESLLTTLQVPYDLIDKDDKFKNPLLSDSWKGLHPYEYLNVRVMGKFQGVIFSLHPLFAKKLKLKGHYSIALLDLTSFENNLIKDKTKYAQIAKFPHATFDCTVMTATETSVAKVLEVVQKMRLPELQSCKVVGTYQVTNASKSVTLRCVFGSAEATLSGESIKNLENVLCDKLRQEGFPLKQ